MRRCCGLLLLVFVTALLPSCGGKEPASPDNEQPAAPSIDLVSIPPGTFTMGDHQGLGGAEHGNDEIPLHSATLTAFAIGRTEITTEQYIAFLNDALTAGELEVTGEGVRDRVSGALLCDTRAGSPYSRVLWSGASFQVADGKERHPITGVRWAGAAAFTNWLNRRAGLSSCYTLPAQGCDVRQRGYRLPTEAEWEYAARGGQTTTYRLFPWGDDTASRRANWPASGDPFEAGALPWTTPVAFYDGSLRHKSDYAWPAAMSTYQTADGRNGFGLYDTAGNVWEWVHDWYGRDYYAASPATDPAGPAAGSPMPDGLSYHTLRGGNWYNGQWGHSRVSNRNPAYYRGPEDPNHPWYHIGFRIAFKGTLP